jgi:hypothetical protein
MRNLVYTCVFRSKEYITLFEYLARSIALYGEFPDDTDFIVITQPDFEEGVFQAASGIPRVSTRLRMVDSVFESSRAKLHIFDYDLSNYTRILYLDTDIVVNEPIGRLFSLDIDPGKLYALQEGTISHDHWGGDTPLFDLTKIDGNTTAFCAGVLLFRNSVHMKELFAEINDRINLDIYERKIPISGCLEQPHINYGAIMKGAYDNQLLKSYIMNNPIHIQNGILVYHFPGGPGWHWKKIPAIKLFFRAMQGMRELAPRLLGKTYHWGLEDAENTITFQPGHLITYFGEVRNAGPYQILNENTVQVFFGGWYHILVFNDTLTAFTSIRKADFQITSCRIKND